MAKEENKKSKWLIVLFAIYLILLIWSILFKLSFSITDLIGTRKINLKPFLYGFKPGFFLNEMIGNVLIFIPFGFYMKMLNFSNKKTILCGFIVSLIFECMQYILQIGISDITDIITNTFGTILGVIFYNILFKILKKSEKVNNIIEIVLIFSTIVISLILISFANN